MTLEQPNTDVVTVEVLVKKLESAPETVEFAQVMSVIDHNYDFEASEFTNGKLTNQAGQNNGSCKIFAFGLLNQLTPAQTLACFGQYYRVDVLEFPDNDDHQNIRNFIITGWEGVSFATPALTPKRTGV